MAKGKLYLCGEYAVVDGGAAVISAVEREITAQIVVSGAGTVRVESQSEVRVDDPLRYVRAAMRVADVDVPDADLVFISQLAEDDGRGRKFGLGSSGAVTVATLRALFTAAEVYPSPEELYKYAVCALLLAGDNGSFGDVACSAYGQMVFYVKPSKTQVQYLREALAAHAPHAPHVTDLVAQHWEGLEIEPLEWPEDIDRRIGWTGHPASSAHLVNAVRAYKAEQPEDYADFVRMSDGIARTMRQACRENDADAFLRVYGLAGRVLSDFSARTGGYALTEELVTLNRLAERHGYTAKFSGAGGGDCGIALAQNSTDEQARALEQAWQNAGIEPMHWTLS
ncbi:phosphomevalonate kinase [Alloscardovia macacae]|uniref:phosphomevalonate kinase n=1 Tax=Alloscardovia macacae TaxID=1160091 RepID=A0A1Y2T0S3_9BIFI|nr:phosphomevalonate kinase [Alloscardovia macacae]OTA26798.1 phosphomevalonate kinase [Alloscardovia macacae]OTA29177.1 phosphomevalonate kinase [Alloscardovia macacae]